MQLSRSLLVQLLLDLLGRLPLKGVAAKENTNNVLEFMCYANDAYYSILYDYINCKIIIGLQWPGPVLAICRTVTGCS